MADQATVSHNGGSRVPIDAPFTSGVVGGLATFGGNVAALAELQAKLIALDLKESAARAAAPLGVIAAGAAVALAATPVLLIGVAELLVLLAHLERAWAYLIVATSAIFLGLALALLLLPRLTASFSALRRSGEELARNVAWIKTVLAYSGRPPERRK